MLICFYGKCVFHNLETCQTKEPVFVHDTDSMELDKRLIGETIGAGFLKVGCNDGVCKNVSVVVGQIWR